MLCSHPRVRPVPATSHAFAPVEMSLLHVETASPPRRALTVSHSCRQPRDLLYEAGRTSDSRVTQQQSTELEEAQTFPPSRRAVNGVLDQRHKTAFARRVVAQKAGRVEPANCLGHPYRRMDEGSSACTCEVTSSVLRSLRFGEHDD